MQNSQASDGMTSTQAVLGSIPSGRWRVYALIRLKTSCTSVYVSYNRVLFSLVVLARLAETFTNRPQNLLGRLAAAQLTPGKLSRAFAYKSQVLTPHFTPPYTRLAHAGSSISSGRGGWPPSSDATSSTERQMNAD